MLHPLGETGILKPTIHRLNFTLKLEIHDKFTKVLNSSEQLGNMESQNLAQVERKQQISMFIQKYVKTLFKSLSLSPPFLA